MFKVFVAELERSSLVKLALCALTVSNFPQFFASRDVNWLQALASIVVKLAQPLACRDCKEAFPVICVKPELLAFNDCKGKELTPSIVDNLEQLLMSKEVTLLQLVRSSFVN